MFAGPQFRGSREGPRIEGSEQIVAGHFDVVELFAQIGGQNRSRLFDISLFATLHICKVANEFGVHAVEATKESAALDMTSLSLTKPCYSPAGR